MTTAILAHDTAPSSKRMALGLPSVRVLTVAASCAFHAGVAWVACQHAAEQPVTRAAPEVGQSAIEIAIAIAPSIESKPALDPAPRSEVPKIAHAPTRSAATAEVAAVPARAAINTPLANVLPNASPESAASIAAVTLGSSQPSAPRFTLQAPAVVAGVSSASAPSGQGSANALSTGAPFPEAQVDTPAKLQAGTPPSYTAAAEAAGVEAELPLEVVIDASGAVQSARALEHVGYGLNEAALAAIRRYRFSPARRRGGPVAVRMRWVLRFQLR